MRLNQFARMLAKPMEPLDLAPFLLIPGERVIAREVQSKRQHMAHERRRAKECAQARARMNLS